MSDQAQRLRDLMNGVVETGSTEKQALSKKNAKIISVSSGKGGVGKTNITLNLAIAIKQIGYEICVIDADIGLSNMEIISGQSMEHNLSDIIYKNLSIEEITVTGPAGISMISGGSGLNDLNIIKDDKNTAKLLFEIQKLQELFDYILIDTGAGISESVTNFVSISDTVVIVSTPEPTSIMDAYVLIKTMLNLGYTGKFFHVTNMVRNAVDAKSAFEKMKAATSSFLKLEIYNLGYIEASDTVLKAVRQQTPFILLSGNSQAAKNIRNMVDLLVSNKEYETKIKFVDRFFSVFRKK